MTKICSFSEAGRKGPNQDSVLHFCTGTHTVLAIADGMGGTEAGQEASRIAVDTLRLSETNVSLNFPGLFSQVRERIAAYANENAIEQMGTTLSICEIEGCKVRIGHVGDTRIYLIRGEDITPLTKDQTEVQKLLDDGILSKVTAAKYHRRNVLLSAMTNFSDFDLAESEAVLQPGDRVVLTTDGVTDLLEDDEIVKLSIENPKLELFVNQTKQLIESRIIKDDYSLVACQI